MWRQGKQVEGEKGIILTTYCSQQGDSGYDLKLKYEVKNKENIMVPIY